MPDLSKESRLRILDAKLFNREKVNFETFSKHLEREHKVKIIERTFERDIKELRDRLANRNDDDETKILCRDRNQDTYKYLDGYFAFEETAKIEGTKIGKLLKYNRNLITDIDQKVRKQIGTLVKEHVDNEEKKISWNPVEFINKENSGQNNFPVLLNHILLNQAIKFTHTNIQKKTTKQKYVVPILLKEVDNGFEKLWFMLAKEFNDGDKEVNITTQNLKIFSIDRIVDITRYRPQIKINLAKDFEPINYFKYSFRGTYRENIGNPGFGPEHVKLKILDEEPLDHVTLEHFKRYPLHDSQKISKKGNETFVDLNIETAYDLRKFIFGYSENVVVVHPENLKEEIKKLLIRANKNYGIGE